MSIKQLPQVILVPILCLVAIAILSFTYLLSPSDKADTTTGRDTYSYLALGDSYTIGESVDNKESWPIVLADELTNEGLVIDETKIIAQTGWRTDNLMDAAKAELRDEKFNLVSLLFGVNNEFQGENSADFEAKFTECLTYAIEHAIGGSENVFVLSIPDYGFTPYGKRNQQAISNRIEAYNSICESVAEKYEVLFLDITKISQNGLKQKDLVATDRLHPSAIQYQQWVDAIKTKVFNLVIHD